MLCGEKMLVYCSNHTKLLNTVCGQNPQFHLLTRGAFSSVDANCSRVVSTHAQELGHGRRTHVTACINLHRLHVEYKLLCLSSTEFATSDVNELLLGGELVR